MIMKHFQLYYLILAFALTMASCGNKSQQATSDTDSVQTTAQVKDNTLYGICGEGTAMNTLQLITDNNDTLDIFITDAKDNGTVLGGLQCGDRLAVMAKKDGDMYNAQEVINLNTLLGNWMMPNPIDGSDYVGIRLKEGGIAESINQSSTFYKTWKIFNGKLILTAQRDGGGDEEELYSFNIVKLGSDSLCIKGSEDKFEFSRSSK